MSEKSMSKDTRKNVILLHIAVMCFSCSGVIGQYVQVPAVQVAMGRVICSSLLLLDPDIVRGNRDHYIFNFPTVSDISGTFIIP